MLSKLGRLLVHGRGLVEAAERLQDAPGVVPAPHEVGVELSQGPVFLERPGGVLVHELFVQGLEFQQIAGRIVLALSERQGLAEHVLAFRPLAQELDEDEPERSAGFDERRVLFEGQLEVLGRVGELLLLPLGLAEREIVEGLPGRRCDLADRPAGFLDAAQGFPQPRAEPAGQCVNGLEQDLLAPPGGDADPIDVPSLGRVDDDGLKLIGVARREDPRQDECPDAPELAHVVAEGLVDLRRRVPPHQPQGLDDLGPVEDGHVGRLLQAGFEGRPQGQIEDGIAGEVLDVGDHELVAVLEGEAGPAEKPDGDGDRRERSRARRDPNGPRPPAEGQPLGRRVDPRAQGLFELAQVRGHRCGRGVSVGRVLGQSLADDAFDLLRETRSQLLHRPRLLVDDGVEHGPFAVPAERKRPGGHLVEDDAERPDVGAGVDVLARGLFGGHVGDRADGHPRDRHPGLAGQLGQAEVEDLGLSIGRDHDVARLDVAVDDAVLVGLGQPPGDLGGDPDRFGRRQVPLGDPVLQAFARIAGHDDVKAAVLGLIDLVDGADVGVVEARRGARFVDETLPGLGVRRRARGEELEGDRPVETEVLGFVNDTHAAPAEPAGDAVLPGHGFAGADLGLRDLQRTGEIIPHFPLQLRPDGRITTRRPRVNPGAPIRAGRVQIHG